MVFAPLSGSGQRETRSIQGRVHRADGGALPSDMNVRLEEAEGTVVAQQFVGSNGKFEFLNLTGNLYRLIVTAPGFQTVSQDVDMHYEASRFPDIYLVSVVQKRSPSSSPTSATDLAAPKKAQKEYEKGGRALGSGNPEEARNHLEKAVAEYPCYARAQTTLGIALSMTHQFSAAEAALKKAIDCDAGFLEAYLQSAILLNLEGKFADNELNLQQGLGHFPNDWQLHYQLGVASDGLKDYAKAEEEYLKAQSINPTPPAEVHVKLADVYLKRKEFEKAYGEMQTYLHLAPNGEFAEETKSLMKKMESAGVVRGAQANAAQPPR
jgi:tetratricopeptide (TPR) repeat protein